MAAKTRFWAGGSSSESESENESGSEEEVQNQKQSGGKFGMIYESDSESDDEVRVVRSHKDKAWDSMRDSIKRLRSGIKINDWSAILDEFKNTNKLIEKSKMLIAKNGLPKFYIKMLVDLEDFLTETLKDKEAQKKMKKEIAKSFNTMKLSLRKHNKEYEAEIASCRANPNDYVEQSSESESSSESDESESESESDDDDDDDSDSDSDSSEEPVKKKPVAKPATKPAAKPVKKPASSSDDDSSDDDSDSDSEEESGSEEEDDDDDSEDSWPSESESSDDSSDEGETKTELKGRAKWLKKVENTSASDKKKAKQDAKKAKQSSAGKDDDKYTTSVRVKQVAPSWKLDDNMTEENLDKKVNELVASRGRKGTDPKTVLYQLEVLSKVARYFGPKKEIVVLMHLISSMFDANRTLDDYMDLRTWRTCRQSMMRVVTILESHKQLILSILTADDMTDLIVTGKQTDFLKKEESDDEDDKKKVNPNEIKLAGSLENYLIRLEDEYTKSLQQINPHTQDYVIRLSDEALLLELAERIQRYYQRIGDIKAASLVALLRVEHLYYKHDSMSLEVRKAYLFTQKWGKYSDLHPACIGKTSISSKNTSIVHPASFKGTPTPPVVTNYHPSEEMESLCTFIFKSGNERSKTRALLCAVYYHALHDNYHRARDLFLISHIQENIEKADTSTQILYNRALVTLGLSAFRQGFIQKAYECLFGVCSGRVRELLAQGTSARWIERDIDQENAERRRQIPYHMHINPDLLEACYLICAMIIELPLLVGRPYDRTTHHRYHFRKYLQSYNRQVFTGPPENTREHVLAAAKSLMTGDWSKACQYIQSLDVWNLIPGVDAAQKVKSMLNIKLKEEALRIYLFSSASAYHSLSLDYICSLFQMDNSIAKRIISKMIFRGEISAAWDQTSTNQTILVLYKVGPSTMQMLALQYSDKINNLVESNERLIDPLNGSYGYKEEHSRKQYGNKDNQNQDQSGQSSYRGNKNLRAPRRDNTRGNNDRQHSNHKNRDGNNNNNNNNNNRDGNNENKHNREHKNRDNKNRENYQKNKEHRHRHNRDNNRENKDGDNNNNTNRDGNNNDNDNNNSNNNNNNNSGNYNRENKERQHRYNKNDGNDNRNRSNVRNTRGAVGSGPVNTPAGNAASASGSWNAPNPTSRTQQTTGGTPAPTTNSSSSTDNSSKKGGWGTVA